MSCINFYSNLYFVEKETLEFGMFTHFTTLIDSWIVDFFSITYTILSFLLQFYKIAELQLCESLINSFKVPKSKKQHQNR